MKVTNLDLFDKNKIPVFILTYMGADYFVKWSEPLRDHSLVSNIQFVIVDNGNQDISNLRIPLFQTSQNLGCAGGWNVIAQIAFNYLGLEKIIIGQDDAVFNTDMLLNVLNETNDNTIIGAYDRSFEFSLFGLTKTFWNTVGMFDENFIYVGCEDNDYKHRAKLFNKRVVSLNYSADMNKSLTSKHITEVAKPANMYNLEYLNAKWGANYEFTHPFNDETQTPDTLLIFDGLRDIYGDVEKFPSLYETETIINYKKD